MLGFEPEVDAEYNRVLGGLAPEHVVGDSKCLSVKDVVRAHFLIVDRFLLEGEGIGGVGPRDTDLLCSAVSRQHVSFGGQSKWTSHFDVCATLFFGLIKNHPFHDANKRTALLCLLFQLYLFNWCPSIGEKEIEDFTVDVAENNLAKYSRFRLLQTEGPDPEVKFISWYLKNNTRKLDNVPRAITYRELQVILGRYSYYLEAPKNNYIDIVKYETRTTKKFLGLFPKSEKMRIRVGQVGFPRWTSPVSKGSLKIVRETTGLTSKDGVDSGAFFAGLDPMQSLITSYHAPLMRLAFR